MQFLTIRRILTVMFVVLVVFLTAVAVIGTTVIFARSPGRPAAAHRADAGGGAAAGRGCIRRLKARLLGRVGPPLLQPWRDLLRLLRKQPVMAENASWLFAAAPAGCLAAIAAAAALVPSFALGMASAPLADLLVIAGLLALARCILALAAMDVGTAFGGIGASREMTFAVFAEPALLLVIFTLALLAGTTNLDVIAACLREGTLRAAGLARPGA